MRWIWLGVLALLSCKRDSDQQQPAATASATATAASTPSLPGSSRLQTRNCRARCAIVGMCHWDENIGQCVARSAEDCKGSRACKHSGVCTFVEQGYCRGTSNEDCKNSEDCKQRGLCVLGHSNISTCVAKKDADCEASSECKKEGHCTQKDGLCWVDDADDCKRSELCTQEGQCSVEPNPGKKPPKRCSAHTNKDCQGSAACKQGKRCTAKEGKCT